MAFVLSPEDLHRKLPPNHPWWVETHWFPLNGEVAREAREEPRGTDLLLLGDVDPEQSVLDHLLEMRACEHDFFEIIESKDA